MYTFYLFLSRFWLRKHFKICFTFIQLWNSFFFSSSIAISHLHITFSFLRAERIVNKAFIHAHVCRRVLRFDWRAQSLWYQRQVLYWCSSLNTHLLGTRRSVSVDTTSAILKDVEIYLCRRRTRSAGVTGSIWQVVKECPGYYLARLSRAISSSFCAKAISICNTFLDNFLSHTTMQMST